MVMLMSSQCYAVVHDRVFVVADAKVLYNQPAHLAISKSCGDHHDNDHDHGHDYHGQYHDDCDDHYDRDHHDHLRMMMICSRSCQSWQFPELGPPLCTWAQIYMIYHMFGKIYIGSVI